MIKIRLIKCCLLAIFILAYISCIDNTDFGQADDITPSPVLESSLIYATLTAPDFIDATTQQERTMISDTTRIEIISDDFFVDHMIRTDLTYLLTNSLERDFQIDFEFLNDENEIRYQIEINVAAGNQSDPVTNEVNVLIEEPEISTFKEATKVVYKIILPITNSPLTSSSEGEIELQSKATFYLEI